MATTGSTGGGGNPLGGDQIVNDNPNKGKSNDKDSKKGNQTVVTNTVATNKFDNGVIDVSIIPYMRHQVIQFTASNLRPNRRVYFFFDDVNVDEYILQANEVQLYQNNDTAVFNAGFSNSDTLVLSSNTSQTASLIQTSRFFDFDNATPSLRDDAKPRKRKRILKWVNNSIRFANSENFTTSVTGNTGTIGAIRINSIDTLRDFFQNSSSNTITLPAYTSSVPNDYWGINGANTIVLVPKKKRKTRSVVAYIGNGVRGFDNVTQTLYLANTAGQLNIRPGDPGDDWGGGLPGADPLDPGTGARVFRTDFEGKIAGQFFVPAGTFRTGDRVFRIIDDLNNDPADCTTRGDYRFTASGLQQTKQDIIIKAPEVVADPPPPSDPRPRPPERERSCFDPNALVSMADGSTKRIADVVIGDQVISGTDKNKINTVIDIEDPVLGNRKMYSFNDGWAFVSEEHPIMTDRGWGAFDPNSWAVEPEFKGKLVKIEVGSKILKSDGSYEEVTSISSSDDYGADYRIYNLLLDGDHTYIVENYVVHNKANDPIAQTFFVDGSEYPNGIFVSGVGLYFYNKDEVLPVIVQIRPTVNGYPHSSRILPYAEATLDSEFITTSDDASVETKISFDVPIYLEPGEYALVVKSDSLEYEVFVSELGSKIIGTNRIVSKQPYLGSFFKSQNASTWDAVQLEDLTFNLYKCVFGSSGSVTFYNAPPTQNAPADIVYTHLDELKLSNTAISYSHSVDSGATTSSYIPDTNFRNPSGRVTFNTGVGGQYRLIASLSTNDRHVSPIVYNKSGLLNAIENIVDVGDIESDDISIINPGYYPGNSNGVLTVTVTDYRGGTQAIATANVNSAGNIANIFVTSGGSGFINTATANIAQTAGTTAATFKVASELDSSGGPITAKYISRQVTLAEGFDAGDLRVFVTAYKPTGTDIKVYYKVKAADDPDTFADKGYVLMNQKTRANTFSSINNFNDAIEYEFEPYDATNSISYSTSTTTYTNFNQFALKIALTTDDTTKVPIVYDMRAIALPAMST